MKIYTRTGDDGTTGLFGGGRVGKNHSRIEAYGTVDELNSILGVAHSLLKDDALHPVAEVLQGLQNSLFVAGADLATPADARPTVPRISAANVEELETLIDRFENDLDDLKTFFLPGGSTAASMMHVARTVCRRAERVCVGIEDSGDGSFVAIYLNRLSDLLFVLARWTNMRSGLTDIPWKP
ncbi:MAG: cob(I)yrinic acid a,c-diamide adenosyltransferase [Rhodothermales bacterium]|nr:cob(I)yrinic acid a,c-diamide adenosyltransferase [Rhodothermales bacterium]